MIDMTKNKKRSWVGRFALLLALSALTVSVLPTWLASVDKVNKPTVGERMATTGSELKRKLTNKLKGIETPEPAKESPGFKELAPTVGLGLGFLGVVLGVIAYVRREDVRLAATAAVVAVTAIAWHSLFAAIVLAVMLLVIGVVVRGMGSREAA